MGQLSLRTSGGGGLIPANGLAREYWAGSSTDHSPNSGGGADLGKGQLRPSGNTGKGRLGRLPTMAVTSPSWRTGAKLPGLASDSAPGSAFGSPAPCVV